MRKGAFHVIASGGTFTNDDPSRCGVRGTRNIPVEANGYAGENASRIANPAHDAARSAKASGWRR